MMNSFGRRLQRIRSYTSAVGGALMELEPLEPRNLFSGTVAMMPAVAVAEGENMFAFDMFKELGKTEKGNIFFSPYSIATALEMTLQGAGGETAAQIIRALHLPSADVATAGIQALYQLFQGDGSGDYTLSTANRLWVKDNFALLGSYLEKTQAMFGAGPESVDFSDPEGAAATINQWVSDQTHGKITNLISASMITPLTRLVLTNAIYFKGDWASAFNADNTQDARFENTPTQESAVRMMFEHGEYEYYEQTGANGFQALDLGYKGGDLDMVVILPTADTLGDFDALMTPELFSQITSHFSTRDVNVWMPKFTLNEKYDLKKPLQDLGVKDAFSDGADFSGIADQDALKIGVVVHKSYIKVDEKGTEAAAATGIGMMTITAVWEPPAVPVTFDADHPFLLAIRDRATGTILFMGQVTDPGYDGTGTAPAVSSLPARSVQANPVAWQGGPLRLQPPLVEINPIATLPSTFQVRQQVVMPLRGMNISNGSGRGDGHGASALPAVRFSFDSTAGLVSLPTGSVRPVLLTAYEMPALSGSGTTLGSWDSNLFLDGMIKL